MPLMKPASDERIERLINRLTARHRLVWAARIYGHWLEHRYRDANDRSSPTTVQLWRYGRLLRDAGDYASGADVFRRMSTMLSQPGAGPEFLLQRGFDQWAHCLDAMGLHQSAAETHALGRRAASCKQREREEDGQQLRTLSPSRLLVPVASRITFIMSLAWESSDRGLNLFEDAGFLTLRDRFRTADNPGGWLHLEAKAPAERNPSYPHVALCVRMPWRFDETAHRQAALDLINAMNFENAACSVCLDPETRQITLRSRIGFAGYNDIMEPLEDTASAQHEATLNMFAEVIGSATRWETRVAELSARLRGTEQSSKATAHD